jgi:prepilin-type N-terminal cleavage/methylation domain-containing protein
MRKLYGFSLIELLVALSILAIVAAIVVPRFLGVRENSATAVATNNFNEIQNLSRQFVALGGTVGQPSTAHSGELLVLLTTQATGDAPRTVGNSSDSPGSMGSSSVYLAQPITPNTIISSTSNVSNLSGLYYSSTTLKIGGGEARMDLGV